MRSRIARSSRTASPRGRGPGHRAPQCLATAVEWGHLDQVPPIRRLRVPPSAFRFLRDDEAGALVAAALAALPRTTGVVFDQVDTYRQASRAIERFSKAAGLAPVGWHTLRHTFASKLVAAGVPIRAVQDLLGHASIQMTMRYAHLGPQELRAAMNVLEPENTGNPWATPTRDVAPPIEGTVANVPQESQNHRVETVV